MEQQTRYDVLAGKLKNHKLGAVILAAFVVLIALGSATESIQRLWSVVAPADVPAPPKTAGMEAIPASAPPKPMVTSDDIPAESVPSPECRYVFLLPLHFDRPPAEAVFRLDSDSIDITKTLMSGTILTLKHFDHGRYSIGVATYSERRVGLDLRDQAFDAVPAGVLPTSRISQDWGNKNFVLTAVQNYSVEPESTGTLATKTLTDNEARRYATRFQLSVPDCSKAPSGVS